MPFGLLRIRNGATDAPPPDVAEYSDTAGKNKNALVVTTLAEASGEGSVSSLATGFGAVTKAVVKSSPGNVRAIRFTNVNAAVRYAQLHDKATAPAGTNVPLISIPIPAGTATAPGVVEYVFNPSVRFGTGIGWAVSTTQGTFTDSATASEHNVLIEYV